jgi:hypothetical protein
LSPATTLASTSGETSSASQVFSKGSIVRVLLVRCCSIEPWVFPCANTFSQKYEIEKIVQDSLEGGVIHPNTSPYSSPIVMVLKKEGTWCMYIDFHVLNKLTIKDKFIIPIIDDLFDELSGEKYFTKFDLCFVYHHIHMKEEDIPKTTFLTHDGHNEFLVMPFGLCNEPSTFRSLINHVFRPFHCHFVLVFFDDIIIYSCCRKISLRTGRSPLRLDLNPRQKNA